MSDHLSPVTDPSVVVAMPTFRRESQAVRAVSHLQGQLAELQEASGILVVIDNDPSESARPFLEGQSGVEYLAEGRPGIAAARNRALAFAFGIRADVIVFIDDDETPEPGWLQAMVNAWKQWGCAGITGPVTFLLPDTVDRWVLAAGIFSRAERVTGSVNPGASSANLLLDLGVLQRLDLWFDDRFGLSGGSDTMLAHALRSEGEVIRWCQEAGVTEYVPPMRVSRRWVFARTIRTSNTWGRVGMEIAHQRGRTGRVRIEYSLRAGIRLIRGSTIRAIARFRDDVTQDAQGAMDVASGLGLLAGTWGLVRQEYQRGKGSNWVAARRRSSRPAN